MRVYLPSTMSGLAALAATGEVGPAPLRAYAVTPALREWHTSGDIEELEYAAMSEAARASLRLLAADQTAPRRRVVLAADVPDAQVAAPAEPDRALVLVRVAAPTRWLAAVHADAAAAEPDVRAAVDAVGAADSGDLDAQFAVDGAEDHELLWYGVQELSDLLGQAGPTAS